MKKNLKDKLQKIYDDYGSKKILETLSDIFIEKGIAFNNDTLLSLADDLNQSLKKHWNPNQENNLETEN